MQAVKCFSHSLIEGTGWAGEAFDSSFCDDIRWDTGLYLFVWPSRLTPMFTVNCCIDPNRLRPNPTPPFLFDLDCCVEPLLL